MIDDERDDECEISLFCNDKNAPSSFIYIALDPPAYLRWLYDTALMLGIPFPQLGKEGLKIIEREVSIGATF